MPTGTSTSDIFLAIGTWLGCFKQGFEIHCDNSFNPPGLSRFNWDCILVHGHVILQHHPRAGADPWRPPRTHTREGPSIARFLLLWVEEKRQMVCRTGQQMKRSGTWERIDCSLSRMPRRLISRPCSSLSLVRRHKWRCP
jgi:hypothetical protein